MTAAEIPTELVPPCPACGGELVPAEVEDWECTACGAQVELSAAVTPCEWFLRCDGDSVGTVEHPTLGDVEICAHHLEWLQTDWSPTKMVPPMAARSATRHGLAELVTE